MIANESNCGLSDARNLGLRDPRVIDASIVRVPLAPASMRLHVRADWWPPRSEDGSLAGPRHSAETPQCGDATGQRRHRAETQQCKDATVQNGHAAVRPSRVSARPRKPEIR